ncbi:MAG: sigma-70 family RNA polymerase sigma factor [Pirellulaceae bacterium]|nr:sigma-70 family RNA polymerase sigma factor [Pirellulaceae bacterium]
MDTQIPSNTQLLESAKNGDADSLGVLLERYRPYLRLLALRYIAGAISTRVDPSDVIQQTCLDVHLEIANFRGSHEAQWSSWLRRILENNVHQVIRRHIQTQKRTVKKESRVDETPSGSVLDRGRFVANVISPSHQAMNDERAVRLVGMLEDLGAGQREAIRLRFLEGNSLSEIALIMDRTEMAVAGLVKRGLRKLREQQSKYNPLEESRY